MELTQNVSCFAPLQYFCTTALLLLQPAIVVTVSVTMIVTPRAVSLTLQEFLRFCIWNIIDEAFRVCPRGADKLSEIKDREGS